MNERIRELAEQAFFDEATSQPSDRMYTFSDYKMEKFAKLIVRECIDVVSQCNLVGVDPIAHIKVHFGVK